MNKKKIEENDQLLIKKFRGIVDKKKKKFREKPVWKKFYIWLPILSIGLIIAGFIVFREQPATIASNNSEPSSRKTFENDKVPVPKKYPEQPKYPEQKVITGDEDEEGIEFPDQMVEKEKDPPKITGQSNILPSIKIDKIVSCSNVINRQYVSPKTIFSLKEESTPMVWMTVLSDNPPFTLTHIYYVNKKKYCEVPLQIRYPHMRTWSNVTLHHPDHIGKWRVEVIAENGEKLDQVEFTIVE